MPIQTLSETISRLISHFTRTIMFPMPTLRRISPRWSSSLNSSWRKHLTHSVTLRIHCNRKQKTFASRMFRMFPDSIVANYVDMQWLTRGLSFASTPSPYLYADDLQDSSAEIAAVRLLPGGSTTSKNRISSPTFSGVTHISIIASADTILPSHQHLRRISNDPACRKTLAR